jgi:hypothetical protein
MALCLFGLAEAARMQVCGLHDRNLHHILQNEKS